jgi:hypothetical protein
MRRGLAGKLAVAAVVALALPAHALADESLSVSGSITYTWQADPAHGCAAAGLCGVQGELIVQPQGDTSATSFNNRNVSIPIFDPGATIRASGPGGVCVDAPSGLFGGELSFSRRSHGRSVARIEPPFSSGRCAGPTAQDLGRLTLAVRRFGGKRPSYDLRTSRSFVAGPFSGRMVSTLLLRPSTGGASSSSQSFGVPSRPPAPHKVLVEQVTLRYRVSSLPSTLDMTFSGEPDPFCTALASCGASGSLALSFPRLVRTFVVRASRVVGRRVGARRALADFRRGLLSAFAGPPIPFRAAATRVSETLRAADGTACQSVATSRQAQLFLNPAFAPGSAQAFDVVLNDPNQDGLLRTYCPGPTDTDVFGLRNSQLASTKISFAQLLRRSSVVTLARPGSFSGPGYVGTRGGALEFSLNLEHVRAGTVREGKGP